MDMLIAAIVVLVLALAVAQFFITAGAFKRPGSGAGGAPRGPGETAQRVAGGRKSKRGAENSADSSDSSVAAVDDKSGGGGA